MKIRFAAKSDVGMHRTHNEDCFATAPDDQLFVVADGMGGHASGEIASRLAIDSIVEFYRRTREDEDATWPHSLDRRLSYEENRMSCAVKLANQRVLETARREPRYAGMGTTIVAGTVLAEQVCIAHVGDSRAYRVGNDAIVPLTRDHSLLEDMKEANPHMTEEEERSFPHKNVITRALGLRDVIEVAVALHVLSPSERYLMCTDGLSGMLTDAQILRITSQAKDVERIVAELVDAANRAGGTDNVTVLLLEMSE